MPIEMLPVIVFFAGALLVALTGGRLTGMLALLTPLAAAFAAWQLWTPGQTVALVLMDYSLMPLRLDGVALVFASLFMLAAFLAALYAFGQRDRLQLAAMLVYTGAGTGAVLAGDFISLFIFWELIALGGAMLVLAGRSPAATRAAVRYLVFQVTCGVLLMAGLLLHIQSTDSLLLTPLALDNTAAWLLLVACGIKTGFPLLHGWIPDAYPRSTAMGGAVLVAVTTKVGIYALLRLFSGEEVLIYIGLVMALWPLFYALVEDDLRRVLAYTLMVQLGLMVSALGVGSALALDGVVMHVVMDVLFKMLLFMALGVILLRTGTTRASELGGLARRMPFTTFCVAVGVAANCAMPLTGAFESKKLLLGALEYGGHTMVWLVLMSLSAAGMIYLGVRILWDGLLRPAQRRHDVADAPLPMALAMSLIVALILLAGLWPALTDVLRLFGSTYNPLTAIKIIGQVQLLLFAVVVFVLASRLGLGLPASRPAGWLDADWVYRRLIPRLARRIHTRLAATADHTGAAVAGIRWRPGDGRLSQTLARSWPTGSMALWAAILLAVLLVFGLRTWE